MLSQGNDSRKVAVLSLSKGWVHKAVKHKAAVFKVHLGFVVVIQPFLLEQAVIRIDGLVLFLTIKGCLTLINPHLHQVIIGQLLLPQDLRPFEHLCLMGFKECLCVLLMGIIGKVRVDVLPFLPEVICLGEREHCLVFDGFIPRIGQGMGQQAVIVQQGPDIHDIRITVACLGNGLVKPV